MTRDKLKIIIIAAIVLAVFPGKARPETLLFNQYIPDFGNKIGFVFPTHDERIPYNYGEPLRLKGDTRMKPFINAYFYILAKQKIEPSLLVLEKISRCGNDVEKQMRSFNPNEGEERQILRRQWAELLGTDLFCPYFKMLDVEDWLKKKASLRIFSMTGKPEFKNNKIRYVFRASF